MTNEFQGNPCLKGLTARCFQQQPKWAKQAFAYRLLHTIAPREITKKLPKGLNKALIGPGVSIPPGLELPPGTTVPPGTEIPPGWTEDQGAPAGSQPPPPPPATGSPIGPGNVQPGPGATGGTSQITPPLGPTYFLQETCDVFPGSIWTENSVGDGDVSTVSGRFRLTVSYGYGTFNNTFTDPWPTDFDILFTLNAIACDSTFSLNFWTGTHKIGFLFNCPTDTLKFSAQGGSLDLEVYDIEGKNLTYKLELRSGKVAIYRDATLIDQNLTPELTTATPGYVAIGVTNQGDYYLDDLFIINRG